MLPGLGSDWEIDPANIAILRRPDGSEWELGSGASGRVWSSRIAVAAALESSVEDYQGQPCYQGLKGILTPAHVWVNAIWRDAVCHICLGPDDSK